MNPRKYMCGNGCIWARLVLVIHCACLCAISWKKKEPSPVNKQISICGFVPVKLCNLFTKNKAFEIVKKTAV